MGTWQETNRVWHQLESTYCDLCGKLIPRRLWIVEVNGARKTFCDEGCERLYRDYWLTDGQNTLPPASLSA